MIKTTYYCDFCSKEIDKCAERCSFISSELDLALLGIVNSHMHQVCFYNYRDIRREIKCGIRKMYEERRTLDEK